MAIQNYKVVELKDGSFSVGYGNKYFPNMVYSTEKQAAIECVVLRAQDLQAEMDKCRAKFEELGTKDTRYEGADFGDVLA